MNIAMNLSKLTCPIAFVAATLNLSCLSYSPSFASRQPHNMSSTLGGIWARLGLISGIRAGDCYRRAVRNSVTSLANRPGISTCGACPHCSNTTNLEPRIRALNFLAASNGMS